MLYDLSAILPLFIVLAVLAVAGSVVSLTVLGRTLVLDHRARMTHREGLPTEGRRFDLAV